MYVCVSDLHGYLQYLGRMPVQQHADQNRGFNVSYGLYRDTCPDTDLHLCTADLHLVHVLYLGNLPA